MIEISINQPQLARALDRLELATLPPAKRRKLMQMIGREVAKVNKQRIRAGKAPDGTKWAPTISKRKHKRLAGMSKRLRSKATPDEATIYFDTRFAGMIAGQQHQGHTQQFTAPPPKPRRPRPSERGKKKDPFKPTDSPCSRSQANRLRVLGFQVLASRGKRKRYRKPSLSWIQKHVSQQRASIIIRIHTGEDRKNRWTVETPARKILPEAGNDELLGIVVRAYEKMGWGVRP